jgi:integrase
MQPTIHFTLRVERPSPDGSAAVYIRVTFTRKQIITLATGKFIPLKKEYENLKLEEIKAIPTEKRYEFYCWDKVKERAIKGFRSYESFNLFFDDEKKRANDILYDLDRNNKLSPDFFKREFLGSPNRSNVNFLDYCLRELNQNRSQQYASETKRSYKSVLTKLNDYRPNISITDITYKFLTEYENYMLKPISDGGAGNNKRTVENNMKTIRTMLRIACKNGDLSESDYPFKDYKIKESNKFFSTRDFLEPEEILALEKLYFNYIPPAKPIERLSVEEWKKREENGLITPGEYHTLQAFLLGIYTGLRFRDVFTLTIEQHFKSKYINNPSTGKNELKYFLEIDVHKTGVKVIIPLIDKAMKIIVVNTQGKLCNGNSNQKANNHLKDIQRKAKIDKRLTFHVSRHSFATVAFEYGIPEKVVQSILGHRNRKFTEIYTHLSNKKLFFEMDKMNKGYDETELLLKELKKPQENLSNERINLFAKLQNMDENKLKKLTELLEIIS